ncbi:hypothetical protein [Pseudarthrobacter sp. NPDC080039]|uniref:hypothetical protein n=1 Tax=Pseudarthrobacter sp. NPDC080039 TaxID=3155290 RepID=UPI00344BD3E9
MFLVVGDEKQTKFHVRSMDDFRQLGFDWSKLQIVPDGSLDSAVRFEMGPVSPAGSRPSDVFFEPAEPGQNDANEGNNCKDPNAVVQHNVLVAGWVTEDIRWNPYNGAGFEDLSYGSVILDVQFIDRVYGPEGFSSLLDGATLPGSPGDGQVPRVTLAQDGEGITANSFSMSSPFNQQIFAGPLSLHVELNAWHTLPHTSVALRDISSGFFRFSGRGAAPAGWINLPMGATDPGGYQNDPLTTSNFQDQWFQEDPRFPSNDQGGRELGAGDYIVMWGTLYNDSPHGTDYWGQYYHGLGGYLEIHPWDWIGRAVSPRQRRAAYVTSIAVAADGTGQRTVDSDALPPFTDGVPIVSAADFAKLPDLRFTPDPTVVNDSSAETPSGIHIKVDMATAGRCFKTTYVETWAAEGLALSLSLDPPVLDCDKQVQFVVQAVDPSGEGVPGVPVMMDGNEIGKTGEQINETFKSTTTWVTEVGVDGKPRGHFEQTAPTVTLTVTSVGRKPSFMPLPLRVEGGA